MIKDYTFFDGDIIKFSYNGKNILYKSVKNNDSFLANSTYELSRFIELEKDESGNQPSWGSFIYGCIHSRRMDLLPSRHGNNIFKLWLEI